MKIKVFSDGGARGNPGPAGIGVVIRFGEDDVKHISKYIGEKTNNQAEYTAVIEALKWLIKNPPSTLDNENAEEEDWEIEFFLDSQLVVEQLNGRYKIKNEGLKPLYSEIRELIMDLGGKVSFRYIPREENVEADKLVNQALDKRISN